MIEIKLVAVNFSVQPIKDADDNDAKQLNLYHAPTETVYLVPFSQKGIDVLVADLQLPNDELDRKVQEQIARQQLDIAAPGDQLAGPNGVVDLSNLRSPEQ